MKKNRNIFINNLRKHENMYKYGNDLSNEKIKKIIAHNISEEISQFSKNLSNTLNDIGNDIGEK